jgi:hypothetical protein
MQPERVSGLTIDEFLNEFVVPGKPCIITDGMQGWLGADLFSPAYFKQLFGEDTVQVYHDGFELKNVCPLNQYLDEYFDKRAPDEIIPYVRWYTQLKQDEFPWADDAFEKIKVLWSNPYFLPDTNYLLPFCMPPETITPVETQFPARSLFISGPGARTSMHYDPWGSESVLYQLHGLKKWVLYDRELASDLRTPEGEFVNLANPDHERFPRFKDITPTYEFYLNGGETIYVPASCAHEVETVEGSISLTWNFVHQCTQEHYLNYLESDDVIPQLPVLRYFYSKQIPDVETGADIAQFIRENVAA